MIVAGWADGYRNNSFRTVAALREAGRAAPAAGRAVGARRPDDRDARARGSTSTSRWRAWFDRWLRGTGAGARGRRRGLRPRLDPSRRPTSTSTTGPGSATSGRRPPAPSTSAPLAGPRSLAVDPDVGTAAWIDCAGHLPWGQSGDQREDDARSLTWELARRRRGARRPAPGPAAGQRRRARRPRCRSSSATSSPTAPPRWSPAAALDLAFRDGVHGRRRRRRSCPGRSTTSTSSSTPAPTSSAPGQRLRLSVAGADWPNTVAPPAPVTLTVHDGTLELPLWGGPAAGRRRRHRPAPSTSSEDPPASPGRSADDVLAAHHHLRGPARVDLRRAARRPRDRALRRRGDASTGAPSPSTPTPSAPSASAGPASRCSVRLDAARRRRRPTGYDVAIDAQAHEDGVLVGAAELGRARPPLTRLGD